MGMWPPGRRTLSPKGLLTCETISQVRTLSQPLQGSLIVKGSRNHLIDSSAWRPSSEDFLWNSSCPQYFLISFGKPFHTWVALYSGDFSDSAVQCCRLFRWRLTCSTTSGPLATRGALAVGPRHLKIPNPAHTLHVKISHGEWAVIAALSAPIVLVSAECSMNG